MFQRTRRWSRSGGSQQTGVWLLRAAKSAPLRKRGWRPSVQQSKLNRQMCLCSKYLSPAGYYSSPDGVWAHSLQKSNRALLMWCEKPSLFLLQCMNTWSTRKRFTEHQKEMLNNSFFHAGLGKPHSQGWHFAFVIRKSFWWSRGNITAPSSFAPATWHYTKLLLETGYSFTNSAETVVQIRTFHGPATASAYVLSDS